MNRLKTAASQATSGTDCWGQSYTYDRYANMTGIAVTQCSAPTLSLSINQNTNRITNTGFQYDSSGNLTNDGYATYTWTAEGRMAGTAGYSYTYDGDGRRVKKTDGRNLVGAGRGGAGNSNRKLYWYGLGGEVLAESDLGGNISLEFIYFGGKRIARRELPSGTIYYYLSDRLGNARMIADANGNVVEESDYLPYGTERPVVASHTVDNTYKFTGHERDSESGLDHTEYRKYASTMGRWLSPDSVRGGRGNPQRWNRYAYVIGNPTNNFDPNGQLCVTLQEGTTFRVYCYEPADEIPSPPVSPFPSDADEQINDQGLAHYTAIDDLGRLEGLANQLTRGVAEGDMSQCQALAAFADIANDELIDTGTYVQSLSMFTPSTTPLSSRFVGTSANPITFSGLAGFRTEYSENEDPQSTADQVHHFAAFLQLGYMHSIAWAGSFPAGFEYTQAAVGTFNNFIDGKLDFVPVNKGDINLGIAAVSLGAALRKDAPIGVVFGNMGNLIRTLCAE